MINMSYMNDALDPVILLDAVQNKDAFYNFWMPTGATSLKPPFEGDDMRCL